MLIGGKRSRPPIVVLDCNPMQGRTVWPVCVSLRAAHFMTVQSMRHERLLHEVVRLITCGWGSSGLTPRCIHSTSSNITSNSISTSASTSTITITSTRTSTSANTSNSNSNSHRNSCMSQDKTSGSLARMTADRTQGTGRTDLLLLLLSSSSL